MELAERATVLVVEDDNEIRELLRLYLIKNGFNVACASDGVSALREFEFIRPDLVLLDIQLPGASGLEVCEQIRSVSNVPIMFVSARGEAEDVIRGLDLGADDYIAKPFDPAIVVARVKANLRRAPIYRRYDPSSQGARTEPAIPKDGIYIDTKKMTVYADGHEVRLSAKEYQLLVFMANRAKEVFSASELYEYVWGRDSNDDPRTVMVHIYNMRKKLEQNPTDPRYIVSVRGLGYRYEGAPVV
ncbi:response regulator transcription factor [Paenibacillus ginsengarvi]|uniref:DNA-binding response regulator n=1 Tax=Paenibacillus ginsengarvi TaxID=400777 RepID=A0A3B0C1D2_9BACL|nr:response regulator transcription factor [Paenibacillus ginsengarvi]RKN79070.1 DNA-binding response regulator [Paenibacillus ginsengarvi]